MPSFSQYSLPAYQMFTRIGAPLVSLYLQYRLYRGKEDAARLPERFGYASKQRKGGALIWLHAASIGEAISLLKLISCLRQQKPDAQLLLTTGTVTSAALLAGRLPEDVTHQFVPVDTPQSVSRFLEYWRPTLAVFTESEIWPNMITMSRESGATLALVNARMSENSFSYWQNQPEMIGKLLGCFSFIAAQTEADANRFSTLAGSNIHRLGNLKYDAEPLETDEKLIGALHAMIASRPCLVASSLHPGEDEIIARAHTELKKTIPELLTIIIPRHPDRGVAMLESAKEVTPRVGCRSFSDLPDSNTDIYIADTIGELGLWYRLATVVVIGGSFIPHGGQNLLEPIRLHAPVVVGEHMFNFSEMLTMLLAADAVKQVSNEAALTDQLHHLFTNSDTRNSMVKKADEWLKYTAPVSEVIAEKLAQLVGV